MPTFYSLHCCYIAISFQLKYYFHETQQVKKISMSGRTEIWNIYWGGDLAAELQREEILSLSSCLQVVGAETFKIAAS